MARACASTPSSLFRQSAATEAPSETPMPDPALATRGCREGAGPSLALDSSLGFCSDQYSKMGWAVPGLPLLPETVAVRQMVGLDALAVFAAG